MRITAQVIQWLDKTTEFCVGPMASAEADTKGLHVHAKARRPDDHLPG